MRNPDDAAKRLITKNPPSAPAHPETNPAPHLQGAAAIDPKPGRPETAPAFLNRATVARLLGVSKRTVDTLCSQGLPHMLLGNRCARFDPAEVLAWCHRERGIRRRGNAKAKGGAR